MENIQYKKEKKKKNIEYKFLVSTIGSYRKNFKYKQYENLKFISENDESKLKFIIKYDKNNFINWYIYVDICKSKTEIITSYDNLTLDDFLYIKNNLKNNI